MKGGVPCLGAMFCRQTKSTVAADAIIEQKHDRRESPSTPVNGTRFWRGTETAGTMVCHGVCSACEQGEFHVCEQSNDGNTGLKTTPSSGHKSRELGQLGIDLHPTDLGVVTFSSETEAGEGEHEGGVEDVDMVDRSIPKKTPDYDSDHPMSDAASDLTMNHDYAAHTEVLDSDSARYYQNSLSGIYGTNMRLENSFTDLELASDHVSDPGVYRTKQLESSCSPPILHHGVEAKGTAQADSQFLKQVSPGDRSESESVRHPDSLSVTSGLQIIPLLYESSSAGGEARELPSGDCVHAEGSPRSEDAYQGNTSRAAFDLCTSSQVMESQKRKSWWKVFLVSQRNMHLEVNGGREKLGALPDGRVGRPSPVNNFMSDLESKCGHVSPTLLGVSDSAKDQSSSRRSVESSQVSTHASDLRMLENLRTAEWLKGEISAFSLHRNGFSTGDFSRDDTVQKGDFFTGKTGLSRVEEWVSSVHTMAPSTDDDEMQMTVEGEPASPTAPAASFFGPFGCEYADRKQVAAALTRVDGSLDSDAEMARMVARSVNPLSTVAQFSGVGLKVIPSLGMFGSLKILNLSTNSFVRITPGCLPKSLHSLDISRNNIVVIEGLRELTRLRVLNLSFNRISRIGNGLSSCSSLKEVYLAGNKISEVEGLHRLSKLVVLDLSFNKLTTTKSMGQIAANYKSLQAFNLLGNAVHSNLGDEQMRRFVTGICPQLVYLNKQPLKSVSNREVLGKELKGSGKNTAKPPKRGSGVQLVSSHRRTHSGGVVGNVKKSGVKEGVSPARVSQGDGYSRKGYHQSRTTS